MRKIGILGGTFDPPHIGHLVIAEETRVQLDLEEIWFMPSNTPPHKDAAKTGAEERSEMVKRAVKGNPHFRLNTIETHRLGKSYTFDTMKVLRAEHPDIYFYFIIGADMVEYLPHWDRIDELLELVQFVGVKRQGYSLSTTYPIIEVDVPFVEISSTMIRERIRNKLPIRYLVTESVNEYLKEQQLYEDR
ncbi:nicotinate-nucleotide adenylyltransferase [Lentibacillus sediminis]|uniref:nicotinate-nucleotide adenylyltransferase n=1 Tax=Lentibacillus sediminis TaxID=1940529 RepID=UPI000C1BA72B|nr:nicotinate-nucleotide adenylyltransferase [Lentibacillus sediminis]